MDTPPQSSGGQAAHDTNYRFTGKELDAATGLYYYGARYYDAKLGRFITPDSIVQAPYDPQSLNRYSYCRNNPIRYTDPSGHSWSWKKFWNSFAGVFVGAAITVVTFGAGAPLALAACLGGAVGGAITGGLEGGLKGAVIGAVTGGVLGGLGGAGVAQYGAKFAVGMLAAGTAVAAVTNSWDSFAGGLAGGLCGTAAGATYQAAGQPGSPRNQLASSVKAEKQSQQALCIAPNKDTPMVVGSRKVGGGPFEHMFGMDEAKNVSEMGADWNDKITVFKYNLNDKNSIASAVAMGRTPQNTIDAINAGQVQWSNPTMVNGTALDNIVTTYQTVWGNEPYVCDSFNSNYAVNTWIYGSGGDITGLTTWRPSFSGKY